MTLIRIVFIIICLMLALPASANNELLQQQLYKMAELSVPERAQDTYYNKLLSLLDNPDIDSHSLALGNILKADYYLLKSDFSQAQAYLNVAKPLVEEINFPELKNQYDYANLALLRGSGEIIEAVEASEGLFERVKDSWPTHKLGELVLEQAYLLYFQYKYNESLNMLEVALDYAYDSNDPHQLSETYNMFGILYSELNDNNSAIEYYEKSIAIIEAHPDFTLVTYQYVNLADAYRLDGQYDKARTLLDQSEKRAIRDQNLGLIAFTNQMRSRLLFEQEQYDESLKFLTLAKDQAAQLGEKLFLFEIHIELSKIHLQMDQLKEAKQNLEIALEQSERLGEPGTFYVESVKSEIFARENNFEEAYKSTKNAFEHYRDKFNENLTHVSNIAREQLDRERLTFENKLLEEANTLNAQHVAENKKYFAFLWISIGLLFLSILIAVWYVLRFKKLATTNHELALTDNLTNLPNRRHIFRTLNDQHRDSEQTTNIYSLILFDLDHFKSINDRFGHSVGDLVIQATKIICKSVLREQDTIGRIGGEEFLIILPNTNKDNAYKIAERIRQSFEQYDFGNIAQGLQVTSSFGVTEYLEEDECLDHVVNRADRLLYKAKNEGRNRVAATFI